MHVSFSNGTLGQFWGRYWVHLSSKNNPVELPPSEIVPHTANPGVDPGDCNDDQFACHDGTCVPKVSVLLLPATQPSSQCTIIIVPISAIHSHWAVAT